MYKSSVVQKFNCTKSSDIEKFSCPKPKVQLYLYKSSVVQMFSCTNVQLYKISVVQKFSCTNVQSSKSSVFQKISCLLVTLTKAINKRSKAKYIFWRQNCYSSNSKLRRYLDDFQSTFSLIFNFST